MKLKAKAKLDEFDALMPEFEAFCLRLKDENKEPMTTELVNAFNGQGREGLDNWLLVWHVRPIYLREFIEKYGAELASQEKELILKLADASEAFAKAAT